MKSKFQYTSKFSSTGEPEARSADNFIIPKTSAKKTKLQRKVSDVNSFGYLNLEEQLDNSGTSQTFATKPRHQQQQKKKWILWIPNMSG